MFYKLQGCEEEFLGVTERIVNNLDPIWEKTFVIDYVFELQQSLRFEVWDTDGTVGSNSNTK